MATIHKQHTQKQLRSKTRWSVAAIIFIILACTAFIFPKSVNKVVDRINSTTAIGLPVVPERAFKLGLDLQGGAQLIYEADTNNIASAEKADAVEGVRDVVERRVNGLGVGEPNVQVTQVDDNYRLLVELPGVTDINQAIKMIGETPILEFKEQNNEPQRSLTTEEQEQITSFNTEADARSKEALKKITDGADFATVVAEYSTDPTSRDNQGYVGFVNEGQLDPKMAEWLAKAKEGDVSPTVFELPQGNFILKKGKEQDGSVQTKASHILICYLGAQECPNAMYTKEEALKKAQELYDKANASNFADLAKEFSTDASAAARGGDLGFFIEGQMVPAFEQALTNVDVGSIVGPVETQFGYHVIYKTDQRATKEFEISQIAFRKLQAIDLLGPEQFWKTTGLSGAQLERAEVVTNPQSGRTEVSLSFNDEGTELFRQITERNLNKPVAIFLDGEAISTPNVTNVIPNGKAVITGNFSLVEARLLSQRLNAGALPVPVNLISQESIGATLGAESLATSLQAGVAAIILIMVFMILYYRLPGVIAVIALALYIVLTLVLFKLGGVTLTLAGIAGLILSIGMAMDANILIFERMKEELQSGKSLKVAIEEGFVRAWPSIRDGNASTLITCLLLLSFGSSFVKGFAITLTVGLLISMLCAIIVTRTFLRFVTPWFAEKGHFLFLGAGKKKSN